VALGMFRATCFVTLGGHPERSGEHRAAIVALACVACLFRQSGRRSVRALNPLRLSGGRLWALGRLALQFGRAPASFKYCRTLASIAVASRTRAHHRGWLRPGRLPITGRSTRTRNCRRRLRRKCCGPVSFNVIRWGEAVVREGCRRSTSRFSYTRSRVALRSRPHRFSGGWTSALGRVGVPASRRTPTVGFGQVSCARGPARNGIISLEEAWRSGELVRHCP
jgi:hypothetical protein